MPLSDVGIYNSALVKIGADIISSTTQDTRSANLIRKIYENKRDEVQSAHPWSFTLSRYNLVPNSTTPAFGFDNTFDLPNGWLAIWGVQATDAAENDQEDVDYAVENSQILCDEDTLDVLLGIRNTDPSSWSYLFAEALAWRIATEISIALKQSEQLMQICDKMYNDTLRQAKYKDSIDRPPKIFIADIWTKSRR